MKSSHTYAQTLQHVAEKINNYLALFFISFQAEKIKELSSRYLPDQPNILDIGCGNGAMTFLVQNLFNTTSITGIDNNATVIQEAHSFFPEINVMLGQAESLPYADNTFDLAYCSLLLHHLPQNTHERILREMARVTKKHGLILIIELNPGHSGTKKQFIADPNEANSSMIKPHSLMAAAKKHGTADTTYAGFFKINNKFTHFLEQILSKLPWGSIYILRIIKR